MGRGSKIFVFLLIVLVSRVYSFTSLHQSSSKSASFLSTRDQKNHSGRGGEGLEKRAINNIPQQLGDMIGDMAAVSVGAVAGALSRYQIGNIATRIIEKDQRLTSLTGWHTAAINIFGSFILGSLAGTPTSSSAKREMATGISPRVRLMAGVGFCGAFTTFSTFSVDIVGMLNNGRIVRAMTYATVNNVGGVAAAFAGFNMAKKMIKK